MPEGVHGCDGGGEPGPEFCPATSAQGLPFALKALLGYTGTLQPSAVRRIQQRYIPLRNCTALSVPGAHGFPPGVPAVHAFHS